MGRDDDRERTRSRLGALTRTNVIAEADPLDGEREADATGDVRSWPEGDVSSADSPPSWLAGAPPDRDARWVPERLRGARLGLSRGGLAALLLVGLVAATGAGLFALRERPVAHPVPPISAGPVEPAAFSDATPTEPPPGTQPLGVPPVPPPAGEQLVVSVVGLVQASGLVRLPPGSRVADAIAAAGGAKEGADLLSLNMAARVADGDQILVGVADPNGGPPVLGSAAIGASAGGQGSSAPPPGIVNLNSATEAELDALPGVGPVTAASIVAWRAVNGPFTDVEQLSEVDGIGPAKLAKLRDLVRV
ncbi:ComEA family DNA-binding protein [Aldersonia kunmingensis]|uniref:ComEA family DNA-binding protein n=1 Tax=Aldersonia kunmingensis TaxID=408066 RepID=UPI00082E57D9|nr:ComEA family DNA-binding protein [Aldersonia kunmingensis]